MRPASSSSTDATPRRGTSAGISWRPRGALGSVDSSVRRRRCRTCLRCDSAWPCTITSSTMAWRFMRSWIGCAGRTGRSASCTAYAPMEDSVSSPPRRDTGCDHPSPRGSITRRYSWGQVGYEIDAESSAAGMARTPLSGLQLLHARGYGAPGWAQSSCGGLRPPLGVEGHADLVSAWHHREREVLFLASRAHPVSGARRWQVRLSERGSEQGTVHSVVR